jgi:hypothetical protein
MTPSEMEAELKSLREQFSHLNQQQEVRTKAWLSIGLWCWCFAVLLFALAAIAFSLGVWHNDSSITLLGPIIFLQIFPVGLLGSALWSGRGRSVAPLVPGAAVLNNS